MIKRTNESALMSGVKYNKLMLTGKAFLDHASRRFVECICECGKISFQMFNRMVRNETVSCGCKRKNRSGMSMPDQRHPIYGTWLNIKTRCHQEDGRDFPEYGGSGVIVCDEWRYDFNAFFKWCMDNGWKKGLSLDRYPNNDGDYEPINCRWATQAEQNRNKINNVMLIAFGETKCLQDWLKDSRCNVKSFNGVRRRISAGWDAERAISFPSKKLKLIL